MSDDHTCLDLMWHINPHVEKSVDNLVTNQKFTVEESLVSDGNTPVILRVEVLHLQTGSEVNLLWLF